MAWAQGFEQQERLTKKEVCGIKYFREWNRVSCFQGAEGSWAFYIQAEPPGLLPLACQSGEYMEPRGLEGKDVGHWSLLQATPSLRDGWSPESKVTGN